MIDRVSSLHSRFAFAAPAEPTPRSHRMKRAQLVVIAPFEPLGLQFLPLARSTHTYTDAIFSCGPNRKIWVGSRRVPVAASFRHREQRTQRFIAHFTPWFSKNMFRRVAPYPVVTYLLLCQSKVRSVSPKPMGHRCVSDVTPLLPDRGACGMQCSKSLFCLVEARACACGTKS